MRSCLNKGEERGSIGDLKGKVLRGGGFLALRQGLGILISFVGTALLLRALGPKEYGLYATALGLYTYLLSIGQWGIGTYLVRSEGEGDIEVFQQGLSLMLVISAGIALLGIVSLPLIDRWLGLDGLTLVALALFVGLPLSLLSIPLAAYMERLLEYSGLAKVELGGQLAYYFVALPLAYGGLGVWAPVLGWWSQALFTFWGLRRLSHIPLRWCWKRDKARDMLAYGLSFSSSLWVWQLRGLVNPLIVGRYLGAEAVGYISLTIRLVETLSFMKAVTWRLSIPAFAKIQGDRRKLGWAITEASEIQVLVVGLPLLGFSLLSPWVIPGLFGSAWAPAIALFPFIAVSYLVNAVFNMHSSALYVLQKNWEVTVFHMVHLSMFAAATWVFIPPLGAIAYGWAEIVALASYIVIYRSAVNAVGPLNQTLSVVWSLAFGLALFWQELNLVAFVPLFGVMILPQARERLLRLVGDLWLALRKGTVSGGVQ
ncbi:MAG: oligosaccharide flippase family protein [Thermus sp.]|uniref:oligosaccharide flippase family protein n=1 Tax=Thermus sp. TaxID=275 RepID=UPI00391AB356